MPQVLLVKKRSGGKLYAMKVLHKADILKRNQLRHTLTERSVLQSVKHPFIVQMHHSFQSAHQLFLVRSLVPLVRPRCNSRRARARLGESDARRATPVERRP